MGGVRIDAGPARAPVSKGIVRHRSGIAPTVADRGAAGLRDLQRVTAAVVAFVGSVFQRSIEEGARGEVRATSMKRPRVTGQMTAGAIFASLNPSRPGAVHVGD